MCCLTSARHRFQLADRKPVSLRTAAPAARVLGTAALEAVAHPRHRTRTVLPKIRHEDGKAFPGKPVPSRIAGPAVCQPRTT